MNYKVVCIDNNTIELIKVNNNDKVSKTVSEKTSSKLSMNEYIDELLWYRYLLDNNDIERSKHSKINKSNNSLLIYMN